ncbi:hypothetical protein P175DRAFT_0258296 [Aspergillus ochraceoroseus IBT 24754]|uniref:Uncharacterized protein n=1 Tax=Aspergillus ochraceoroseus IBT 24754 TaxID=1392256 RepID=A0A2T5LU96_9EURO|nr:uncharacterized protein P175DRAFT_0258296 [Aspergillus ochraceoroseus IBT 24754]PTU19859.1 hypothetical protein P175DRAFT_0258296 [Aspergillus ochraceoroseus IBT 24754]
MIFYPHSAAGHLFILIFLQDRTELNNGQAGIIALLQAACPSTKPYDHIPSDSFPRLDRTAEGIFVPCILSFTGLLMFAWDFAFPTPCERLLWRIAAVYQPLFGSRTPQSSACVGWHGNCETSTRIGIQTWRFPYGCLSRMPCAVFCIVYPGSGSWWRISLDCGVYQRGPSRRWTGQSIFLTGR